MINGSPLNIYIRNIDNILPLATYSELEQKALESYYKNPYAFTRLLLSDFKYRANHQKNVIASVEGEQGCQPKGSKVLMSNGEYKNIEDVKIGDEVVSLQYSGNVTFEKVVNINNWFSKENYKLFSKRNNNFLYECSYNHLIPLILDFKITKKGKSHKKGGTFFNQLNVLMLPKEIIHLQENYKTCRWQIKQGTYISEFNNSVDCELDPYFLGVFLGDGCFSKTTLSITSADKDIINKLVDDKIMRVYHKPNNKANGYFYSINGYYGAILKKLGLYLKNSGTKFIPKQALYSSAKYRTLLLSGIIDTDGFVDKKGRIVITTKSKQLAEDINFLTCSIGGNSTIKKIYKKCQVKDFIGTYYNVYVTLGAYKNLLDLQIPFKKNRLFIKNGWHKQGIINFRIEKSEPKQVYGITISGDSQLYFTNNMILTHNCGKSLFSIAMSLWIGKIFGYGFDLNQGIFINPSEINRELRQGENRRRTYLYDEQPQKSVGVGSASTKISLKDYEEICRHTQNNIIFCSPEIVEHAHYFVFTDIFDDVKRIKNKTCEKCPIYSKCVKTFCDTLCDIPFYERDGYPVEFSFLLLTKRKTGNKKLFVPRGIVTFPMVSPGIAKQYDVIKTQNIKRFEKEVSSSWKKEVEEIYIFSQTFSKDLMQKDSKGKWKPKPKLLMKTYFFDYFGKYRFVDEEVNMFVLRIKDYVSNECEKLNVENEKLNNVEVVL